MLQKVEKDIRRLNHTTMIHQIIQNFKIYNI